MGVWTDHVFPRVVDRVLRTPEVNARRALVCRDLHGRVLEIGFGSGLNLRHYPADVTEVLIVEPSAVALQLAQPRLPVVDAPVVRVGVDGASLELPDESVDCVLSTYALHHSCGDCCPRRGASGSQTQRRPAPPLSYLYRGRASRHA
jgi:SAM-dependent methyltransferase